MENFVPGCSKAKVLHVISHMEKGGAERQMMLLTKNSKHNHVILVLDGNERPTEVRVELLSSLRNPISVMRFAREVIRHHRIDTVQLWLPDRMTVPAMIAAKREGCSIISSDRRKVRNFGMGAFRDRVPYINHVVSDIVIPNYPYLPPKLSLRRLLRIPRKVHPILNGLAPDFRRPDLASRPDRLLFVGRLVSQKRVVELIDTLPRLIEKAGVTGLDIVGEGPLEEACRDRIAILGLAKRVTLHGRLSDWGELFSPSKNLLILPSTSEGMSNTLFEAIACGFLPLVSQSPELDIILEGWERKPEMFDPWKTDTIVAAVTRAMKFDTEEIHDRVNVMQSRLAEFSVAKMASRYDDVYDELMMTKQRPK
ncbi:glycosyltransferase [Roseovarius tibetensis]|uniref:glycosyltransferase n=1 Tax=Roseovarius tibetensis TaxID=2685897 RepID=UPI003D7F5DCD